MRIPSFNLSVFGCAALPPHVQMLRNFKVYVHRVPNATKGYSFDAIDALLVQLIEEFRANLEFFDLFSELIAVYLRERK